MIIPKANLSKREWLLEGSRSATVKEKVLIGRGTQRSWGDQLESPPRERGYFSAEKIPVLPKVILFCNIIFFVGFNSVSASVFSGSLDFNLPNTLSGEVLEPRTGGNNQVIPTPSPTLTPTPTPILTATPQPTQILKSELNGKILNFSVVQPTPAPSPKVAFNLAISKKAISTVVAIQTEPANNFGPSSTHEEEKQNQSASIFSSLADRFLNLITFKNLGVALLVVCASFLIYNIWKTPVN